MSKIYVGCDPGEQGAMVAIQGNKIILVQPLLPINKSKGYLSEQARYFIYEVIRLSEENYSVAIEVPYARFGKYSLITSYGWLRGFFDGMIIDYEAVTAAHWQKPLKINTKLSYHDRKKVLNQLAEGIFGDQVHGQMADAALIAYYLQQKENNEPK